MARIIVGEVSREEKETLGFIPLGREKRPPVARCESSSSITLPTRE